MAPLYMEREKRTNPQRTALLLMSEKVLDSSDSPAFRKRTAPDMARVKSAYPTKEDVTWISNQMVLRAGYIGVMASLAPMAQNRRIRPIGVVIREVFAMLYLNTTTRFVRIMAQLKKRRVSYLLAMGACPTSMVRIANADVCKRSPAAVMTL